MDRRKFFQNGLLGTLATLIPSKLLAGKTLLEDKKDLPQPISLMGVQEVNKSKVPYFVTSGNLNSDSHLDLEVMKNNKRLIQKWLDEKKWLTKDKPKECNVTCGTWNTNPTYKVTLQDDGYVKLIVDKDWHYNSEFVCLCKEKENSNKQREIDKAKFLSTYKDYKQIYPDSGGLENYFDSHYPYLKYVHDYFSPPSPIK